MVSSRFARVLCDPVVPTRRPETAVKNTFYAAVRREQRRAHAVMNGEPVPEPFHPAIPSIPGMRRLLEQMGETDPDAAVAALATLRDDDADDSESVHSLGASPRNRSVSMASAGSSRKRSFSGEDSFEDDGLEDRPLKVSTKPASPAVSDAESESIDGYGSSEGYGSDASPAPSPALRWNAAIVADPFAHLSCLDDLKAADCGFLDLFADDLYAVAPTCGTDARLAPTTADECMVFTADIATADIATWFQ